MKYPKKLNIQLTNELYQYSLKRSEELGRSLSAYIRGLIVVDRVENNSTNLEKRITERTEGKNISTRDLIKIVKEEENKIYEEKND